jgi:hypothetical protein
MVMVSAWLTRRDLTVLSVNWNVSITGKDGLREVAISVRRFSGYLALRTLTHVTSRRATANGAKPTLRSSSHHMETGCSAARRRLSIQQLRPLIHQCGLLAAGLDPSGQASPAERQPCRTGGARFTVSRARGRGRRRAQSGASGQTGSTATTRVRPRRKNRARQLLANADMAASRVSA